MDCSTIGAARPATSSVDGTNDARRVHGGHERRHERREERRTERRDDRSEAFAQLKVKVQQTLQGSAPAEAGGSGDNGFEAELKASIHLSGPNGSVDAKIKLSLDAESGASNGGDGNDFASALQGFTEALFSALKTLYGAEPQTPQSATSTVSAPVLTDALASAPSTTIASSTDTPAPATEAAAGSAPAAVPSTDTPAPAESATSTPSSASGSASLSIRVRMTYGSFDGQLGALTHRLAQPDVGGDVPAVGAMFNDLAARFSQLLSTAPGDGAHTTLGGFLAALAHAFKQPSGGTPIKAGPADGAADAGAAAEAPAPTVAVGEPAPTATAPSTQAVSASFSYRQLMTYENTSSAFMLQASLRSPMVYATA